MHQNVQNILTNILTKKILFQKISLLFIYENYTLSIDFYVFEKTLSEVSSFTHIYGILICFLLI